MPLYLREPLPLLPPLISRRRRGGSRYVFQRRRHHMMLAVVYGGILFCRHVCTTAAALRYFSQEFHCFIEGIQQLFVAIRAAARCAAITAIGMRMLDIS